MCYLTDIIYWVPLWSMSNSILQKSSLFNFRLIHPITIYSTQCTKLEWLLYKTTMNWIRYSVKLIWVFRINYYLICCYVFPSTEEKKQIVSIVSSLILQIYSHNVLLFSLLPLFWKKIIKVGLWSHLPVYVSMYPLYQLLNSWTSIYENWYVYHGTWTHLNGLLH
jgi:hypothetical protein